MKRIFTLFIAFIPLFLSAEEIEIFSLEREDHSPIIGYFTRPNLESYPITIYIMGSECDSVHSMQEIFAEQVSVVNSALVTIEKQGVFGPGQVDQLDYDCSNSLDHRIRDHEILLNAIKSGRFEGWNGELLLAAGSEGGAIAYKLAAENPEVIASMIFCTGGGMDTREEVKLAIQRYLESLGAPNYFIRNYIAGADEQMDEALRYPVADKVWFGYTYKWWASHLNRQVREYALLIDTPIYYAHGIEDEFIPIESADALAEQFLRLGKTNLDYIRLEGFCHDVRKGPRDIYEEAIEWLIQILEQRTISKAA